MPNKLSKFWQELKRRNVTRVVAVYIAVAFMVLELVDMISEPFGLPEGSLKVAFFILLVGLLIAVIVSWIYDIHPEGGLEKTESATTESKESFPPFSKGWKVASYISFVIIIGLVVLNLVGGGKQLRSGDIQSLVILPFDNFTGDIQLEYFVSGMHASLIGDMGQLSGLEVKSRTSSNAFKDMDMTIPEIASKLGADAALETAVMSLGDTICVQFRLVSTTGDEEQLWVAEYKEEKSQILNLYNRITKQIAQEVMVELSADEKRRLDRTKTVDIEAYDAFLRSYEYWGDLGKESLDKAYDYLSRAIEKDPDWAPLYAGMAMVWGGRNQMALASPEIAIPKIHYYLEKALKLDPDFAESHYISGINAIWLDWNWEIGEQKLLKALAINPNDALSRMFYAHLLMILQRSDEALNQGQLAVDLDPFNVLILALYADVLRGTGDFQRAISYCKKGLDIEPENRFAQSILKGILYRIGDYETAFEIEKKQLPLGEDIIITLDSIFNQEGRIAAYEEMAFQLELLSQEQYVTPILLGRIYTRIDQLDNALDMLEKAYELHDPSLPYLACGLGFEESLHDHPRYLNILKKMNLPLPARTIDPY